MKRILMVFLLCVSCFVGPVAQSGVEPSPFKSFIESKINLIVDRLMPLTDSRNDEVQKLATEIVGYLQSVNTSNIKRQVVAKQSVTIMDRISSVMFNPQPEPPDDQLTALRTLSRLALVGFNPQPEPPGHTKVSLGILDRISAVCFNPQPEPPGWDKLLAGMEALDGISAMAFDAPPELSGRTSEIIAALDTVTSIALDSQSELAGQPVAEMFNMLDLIGIIAAPAAPNQQ